MNAALLSIDFSHDAVRAGAGGDIQNMAEDSDTFKVTSNSGVTDSKSAFTGGENEIKRRLSFSAETDSGTAEEANITSDVQTLQNVPDGSTSGRQAANTPLPALSTDQQGADSSEEKENTGLPPPDTFTSENTQEKGTQSCLQDSSVTASKRHSNSEDGDTEVVRRALEEGHVSVVFPGTVTQDGCCRFVSEILKCILYQRQQLPMTYDQLVYSQKNQQASVQDRDAVRRRPMQCADMDWRRCQQTLQELEEVLQQLEVLFSLSTVPRVLLLMGGSLILPKELYEINMEALVVAAGDQCLRVSSCLRQLFRTLFVADLLSDTRPVRLMPTTVLALAHRDCGVCWFRPKLQFKVPTRVKNRVIALSTDPSACRGPDGSDWQDYVWFQAPMTIKGFDPKS
ncbi:MAD2L1-binding protein [Pempheris klunzingeri]|uniref:MAD2L1-binding protein n=1 Tax=Pempheris klunzingeri TaxID=3127111 RepID=UPI003981058E